MLLRRVTQHVKDQNWFAVGLDFFIVVLGTLIAFQITNWSEARQERSLEAQYLVRLDTELDVIRTRLSGGTDVFERSARNINLLLQARRDYAENANNPLPADDVLMNALLDVTAGRVPAGSPAAFKEMVASGALGTLTNNELRQALFAYDEFGRVARDGWKSIREEHHNATNGIVSLVDVTAPNVLEFTHGNGGIDEITPVGFNRAEFLNNPDVPGYLTILLRAQVNQHSLVARQLELAENVEALIAEERK